MDDLDKRIEQAQKNIKEKEESSLKDINLSKNQDEIEDGKGARAGSEFLASVFAGAFLGYAIDWYFSSSPWGLMFFIVMGFVSAVFRANAAMKEENKQSSKKNDE